MIPRAYRPGAAGCQLAFMGLISFALAVGMSTWHDERLESHGLQTRPMPFDELCYGWIVGPQVTLVAPTLKWTRGVSSDELRRELIKRLQLVAQRFPAALIAVDGTWVAWHDRASGDTFAFECSAQLLERIAPWDSTVHRLAISAAGDLAVLTERGVSISTRGDAQSTGWIRRTDAGEIQIPRTVTQPDLGPDSSRPDDIAWSGRQLIVAGRAAVHRVVPREGQEPAVSHHEPPSGTPADRVEHAFVFHGLTYLLRADGCFDVLVGAGLSPQVPRVGCLGSQVERAAHLGIDKTTVATLGAGGEWLPILSRPSVVTAALTGGTRQIADHLAALVVQPWAVPAPLMPRGLGFDNKQNSTKAPLEGWRQSFSKQMWASSDQYERTLLGIQRLGWTPLTTGKQWSTAPGVAIRWQPTIDREPTGGRSLLELERALYHRPYDDRQVEAIVLNNSSLSQSLEGTLFRRGWMPIATVESPTVRASALLPSSQFNRSQSKQTRLGSDGDLTQCLDSDSGTTEAGIANALRKGVRIFGSLDTSVMIALGNPTGLELRADAARSLSCPNGFGFETTRILFLDGVHLRATKGSVRMHYRTIDSAELRVSDDAEWPIRVTTSMIAGFRSAETAADRQRTWARRWLDHVLPSHNGTLVLPVTALDMAFTVDATNPPASRREKGLSLAPAEVDASKALSRDAAPCAAPEAAITRREQADLMGVRDADTGVRSGGLIAVAENAIDVLNSVFVSRDGKTVWTTPDEEGAFGMLSRSLPLEKTPRSPTYLTHGTQVASILVAYNDVPGVLHDAQLTWFDLLESVPFANQKLFTLLAGRGAVINISQRLLPEDSWTWLRDGVQEASENILLVAAARNIGDPNEGSPLLWKAVAPVNILGIGVALPDKSIPDGAVYHREFVDLVAPGSAVPVLDHQGVLECIDGTSFAAAYATAGIATLARRMNRFSVPELRARLFATARWLDSYGRSVKAGHIDIGRALDGLDQNILTIERAGAARKELVVEFAEQARLTFKGTNVVGRTERTQTRSIPWADVLRLELRSGVGDERIYRLSAAIDGKYTIYRNVSLAQDAVIGVTQCYDRRDLSQAPDCSGLRISLLRDYVARMLGPNRVSEF